MKKVFLGGTCNDSKWRDYVISKLKVDYFNPVVKDWTPDCQQEELKQRELCDYCLYTITPKMIGVYSIAEAVDDSNKRPNKTLFCFIDEDDNTYFSKSQVKSLIAVRDLISKNGGKIFLTLDSVIDFLNKKYD